MAMEKNCSKWKISSRKSHGEFTISFTWLRKVVASKIQNGKHHKQYLVRSFSLFILFLLLCICFLLVLTGRWNTEQTEHENEWVQTEKRRTNENFQLLFAIFTISFGGKWWQKSIYITKQIQCKTKIDAWRKINGIFSIVHKQDTNFRAKVKQISFRFRQFSFSPFGRKWHGKCG